MKPIKIVGLVGLVLIAAACVGPSSAMAESTALCKEDTVPLAEEKCPKNEVISHTHEVSVSNIRLLSSVANVECEVLFLGTVTSANNLGSPLGIEGNFTYPENANCKTTSGTACEIKETSAHAFISVLRLGHELGDVTYKLEWNVHCGGLVNCTYDGTALVGHDLGPLLAAAEKGETRLEEQTTNKTGGFFCPKTAKLDLLTTPLEATYLAAGVAIESAALCREDAVALTGGVCPEAKRISHVHETTTKGILLSSLVTIECEVLFLGTVTSANNLGSPLGIEGNFTYPENANCKTTSGTACEIKETSAHAFISVLRLGHELGDVTYKLEWNVHCGGLVNCTYDGTALVGHDLGPLLAAAEKGETRLEEQTTNKTGGFFCPKTAKLDLLTTPLEATYMAE